MFYHTHALTLAAHSRMDAGWLDSRADKPTDGWTDGQTDRASDAPTDNTKKSPAPWRSARLSRAGLSMFWSKLWLTVGRERCLRVAPEQQQYDNNKKRRRREAAAAAVEKNTLSTSSSSSSTLRCGALRCAAAAVECNNYALVTRKENQTLQINGKKRVTAEDRLRKRIRNSSM